MGGQLSPHSSQQLPTSPIGNTSIGRTEPGIGKESHSQVYLPRLDTVHGLIILQAIKAWGDNKPGEIIGLGR